MRAQLSNRDYEQLSAYIDGQLAPGERRRLEERIHTQPELQVALDELNRTRTLLKQAPRRHAPRNFTLTPEMIGEANLRRKRSRGSWSSWGSWGSWNLNLFPILSFSSALALLVLVALLIFQLLPGKRQTMTVAQAPQAQPNVYTTESARNAAGSGATGSAAPAYKGAVEPTQAAAENQAAADQAAQPAAGAAAESQAAPAGAAAAPAATAPAAMLQAPAAAAPAAGTPAAGAGMPNGAAAKAADSGVPPIIAWNGASPYGDQAAATGRGGGGGGGGAALPEQGSLLGPPAANNTYGTVPSGQEVYGMGGGGGGMPNTSPLTGPVNLPAESVNSLADNNAARTANPPAPVNNAIQGAGPILGVPGSGQGGQIIEQRSLVGSPNDAQPAQETPAGQRPAPASSPADASAPDASPTPGSVSLPVLEALLGLIALITGGAALYLWRQNRR